jgi:hypothetical protein
MQDNLPVTSRPCPNCGVGMKISDLECRLCGFKATLSPSLAGTSPESVMEPPIEQWKDELSKEKNYSQESLEEVKKEFKQRQRLKSKRVSPEKKLVEPKENRVIRSGIPKMRSSTITYVVAFISLLTWVLWIYQFSGISINSHKSPYAVKVGDCIIRAQQSHQSKLIVAQNLITGK